MRRVGPARAVLDFARPPPRRRCELCSVEIGDDHAHVLSGRHEGVLCACHACAMLVPSEHGELRRIAHRVEVLDDSIAADASWRALAIPVGLACIVPRGDGGVRALYPGPLGVVEADVGQDAWCAVVSAFPELGRLAPEVEGLLVQRGERERLCLRVSIDVLYALVGLMRQHRMRSEEQVRALLDRLSTDEHARLAHEEVRP